MYTSEIPEPHYVMLREEESYIFSDYFRLGLTPKEALRFHGYDFTKSYLDLAMAPVNQSEVDRLRSRIKATLPSIVLDSEFSRREFLIAPVILELLLMTKEVEVRTEYKIAVSKSLRGVLDYWLEGRANVVIAEAKLADMEHGFTQLAVELVAVDQMLDSGQPRLLGAVSIGDVWRFGLLDRERKLLTQDLQLYTIPDDLEQVLGILAAALN